MDAPSFFPGFSLPFPLALRSATSADSSLLEALFRSAREYLARLPLPREQLDLLIEQQYSLQQNDYARRWPRARCFVIEHAGTGIGKLHLHEDDTQLHIIDFVLVPQWRGQGLGTAILRAVQDAAGQRRVTLAVDRHNAGAQRLYRRLGFEVEAVSDSHQSMCWTPARPDLVAAWTEASQCKTSENDRNKTTYKE